ncbi:single-stranded nucleic acid binding R3H [Gilbertella persicaria]|uniref:single-stranded nucleic acid binding R3H n=1 Tax=Gilbertella persicaria TaxID=101096 RepID=UPI002220E048|nr:single-stranded nucleic acid binding R3H [Gilbertella persicaria]KAI8091372.1 single-stranded nucleic acid binding R3H [Gilbertella persicaria]
MSSTAFYTMSSSRDEQQQQQQQQQQPQQPQQQYVNPYLSYQSSPPLSSSSFSPAYHKNTPSPYNNGPFSTHSTMPLNDIPAYYQPQQVYQVPTIQKLQEFNDPIAPTEPDEFITDLLKKPQERLFLLKLELEFEAFIKDERRLRLDLPNMNSYQRLMVHKLAPYYKLNHYHDAMRKGVYVCKTTLTELPSVRLPDITDEQVSTKPITNDPPPQFKIMRRSAGSSSPSSRASSTTNEEQAKLDRKNMTLEERKTAYEEARARIFQDLDGK